MTGLNNWKKIRKVGPNNINCPPSGTEEKKFPVKREEKTRDFDATRSKSPQRKLKNERQPSMLEI
jgi:hypothetical protein